MTGFPGNPIRPYRNKDDELHFLELPGGGGQINQISDVLFGTF